MALGKQAKTLTQKQIEVALSYLATTRHGLRNQVIFLLSTKADLRAKEIAGLRWSTVVDGGRWWSMQLVRLVPRSTPPMRFPRVTTEVGLYLSTAILNSTWFNCSTRSNSSLLFLLEYLYLPIPAHSPSALP